MDDKRPKLPPDDPYSEEAEERRAQRDLDRAKGKAPNPLKEALGK
jgi:hypothetical protein